MVAAANKLLTGALFLLDVKELFSRIKPENHAFTLNERVNLVAQAIFSTIRAISIGADVVVPDELGVRKGLKIAECASRVILFPIEMSASDDLQEEEMISKLCSRLSGMMRSLCDITILQEKQYLNLSPEELKTAVRIYYDPEKHEMHESPIDPQECRTIIKTNEYLVLTMNAIDLGSRIDFSSACDRISDFFEFCHLYRSRQAIEPPPEDDVIAANLQDDPVLSENTCPITLCPIRHPLRDPTTRTIYEARAIITWVIGHGISPLSRRLLRVEDLEPVPELEARIVARLQELQNIPQ